MMAKKIRTIILIVLFIASNFFSFFIGNKIPKWKDKRVFTVDFKYKENNITEYNPSFINPLGLYYLYQKENKNCSRYIQYFDTLTYFRENLWYYNVSDTNYLILYRLTHGTYPNDNIYGFTKNNFFVFIPHEMSITNFPIHSSRR